MRSRMLISSLNSLAYALILFIKRITDSKRFLFGQVLESQEYLLMDFSGEAIREIIGSVKQK